MKQLFDTMYDGKNTRKWDTMLKIFIDYVPYVVTSEHHSFLITDKIDFINFLDTYDNFTIYDMNGHCYVVFYSRDLSYCFELKLLTNKGMQYFNKVYWCEDYNKTMNRLANSKTFSKLPHFVSKIKNA